MDGHGDIFYGGGKMEVRSEYSDGTLYVRGLVEGDRISLYSPSGQLVTHATATTAEWSMPLYYQSGYVVKVNDKAYKVVNK